MADPKRTTIHHPCNQTLATAATAYAARHAETPEAADACMQRLGIQRADGELTAVYGGDDG